MIVRVAPNGFVHEVSSVQALKRFDTDVLVFKCRQRRMTSEVTVDFPQGCKRCHRCFPAG